ncbi:MAG: hypothetical protein WCV92_02930 [Candidatus Buchananbacteria bacterium]
MSTQCEYCGELVTTPQATVCSSFECVQRWFMGFAKEMAESFRPAPTQGGE